MIELAILISLVVVGVVVAVFCGVRPSSKVMTIREFDKNAKRLVSSELPGNVTLNHTSQGQDALQKEELMKRNQVSDSLDVMPGDTTLRNTAKSHWTFTLRFGTFKRFNRASKDTQVDGTLPKWAKLPKILSRKHVANSLESSQPSNPSGSNSLVLSQEIDGGNASDKNIGNASTTGTLGIRPSIQSSPETAGIRPSIQEIEIRVHETSKSKFKKAVERKPSDGDNPIINSTDLKRVRKMQNSLLKSHTQEEDKPPSNQNNDMRDSEFTDFTV